jgi:predicted ATPase
VGADFLITCFTKNDRMPVENPNLFVVTGGPGSGKTTLLLELRKLGFQFAPEVARQIIQQQVKVGGKALPWADRELYTELMLQASVASYQQHTPTPRPMFSDRGIPDTLAYARLIGLAKHDPIRGICAEYRYAARVFLAPPWKDIYETDSERKQDFEEAKRTYSKILEVYEECGYQLVELPKIAPQARAEFVLAQLPV